MPNRLDQVDLTQKLKDKEEYEQALKHWQLKLLDLEQALRTSDRAAVIAFEGWDASGKGGAIKRLLGALDPRGYKAYGIAAPTPEEKSRHYLWRFWDRTPATGELVIFDRTWYGRVLVERVEGFATKEQWERAYDEINQFEQQLHDNGTLVLKFWLHISAEEQLKRFKERQDSPLKSWKLTDDDWRNREKRPQYLKAAQDMFKRTDTADCPWHLVAAEHKWFARVEVLKTTVKRLETALGKHAEEGRKGSA